MDDPRIRFWIDVALALLVVQFCTHRHVDPDLWGHVLYGLEANRNGLPRFDPYAYSLPQPAEWHNHEWLAEAIMAGAYATLGPAGLLLLQAFLGSAAGLIGWWLVRDRCPRPLERTIVVFLFALTLAPGIQVRPQTFTYFFFAILLLVFHLRKHKGRDWTPAIPFVIAAWVNCHGGFLSGLGIYALFEFAEAVEAVLRGEGRSLTARVVLRRGSLLALAGAATLANPYGAGLFPMLGRSVTSIRTTITEWASLSLSPQYAIPIALIAVIGLAWTFSRRDRHLYQLALLGVTVFLGIRHVRHLPFVALTAAACLPEHLESALRSRMTASTSPQAPGAGGRRVLLGSIGVLILVLVAKISGLHLERPFGLPSDPGEYPLYAVRWMKESRTQGNLLVFFDWAQYSMWHLSPEVKVFFDGRFRTVYPPEIEQKYLDFQDGVSERWRRALDEHPTEWVLIPNDLPVAVLLEREPGWRRVYRDSVASLYGKESSDRVRPLVGAVPVEDPGPRAREAVTYFP